MMRRPRALCAVAAVNGQQTAEDPVFLESIRDRPLPGPTPFVRQTVHVTNVLGTFSIDMLKPAWILMPTVEPARESIPPADSHECYWARHTPRHPRLAQKT